MARLARAEVFAPDEVAVVHVIGRVLRRCFLLGNDPVTGKNFDHRKIWIDYWELLDWTARQKVRGKRGATPTEAPPIVQRLSMSAETWCELVHHFGRLFYNVAGQPERIEATRSRQTNRRFHTSAQARSLFATGA